MHVHVYEPLPHHEKSAKGGYCTYVPQAPLRREATT